jgi:hypothetical protein
MGTYDWAFQFDDLQIDIHLASGQGVFTVHSLIKCKHNRIYGASSFGNHYQKSHHEDVVFPANWNHKATYDVFCKSDKPLLSDGSLKHIRAEGRLESFIIQGEVCCLTFGAYSSDLVQGDS